MMNDTSELLKKYIRHIIYTEGTDFMDRLNSRSDEEIFTEIEIKTLLSLSDEVVDELNKKLQNG